MCFRVVACGTLSMQLDQQWVCKVRRSAHLAFAMIGLLLFGVFWFLKLCDLSLNVAFLASPNEQTDLMFVAKNGAERKQLWDNKTSRRSEVGELQGRTAEVQRRTDG